MVVAVDPTSSPAELRAELAEDLVRGGYVFRERDASGVQRFFDKYLVLSRPGLLTRAAPLLADLLPTECERIAVTGVASAVLGGAVAQYTGVPLLIGLDTDSVDRFGGEIFPGMRAVLLEDVVETGGRALEGADALAACGAEVLTVLCLLDRDGGASGRLAEASYGLRALFTETQLPGLETR